MAAAGASPSAIAKPPIAKPAAPARDRIEQDDFCNCCGRPVYGGAVIVAGGICCSIECALQNSDSRKGRASSLSKSS